jgi:hypothetical protein
MGNQPCCNVNLQENLENAEGPPKIKQEFHKKEEEELVAEDEPKVELKEEAEPVNESKDIDLPDDLFFAVEESQMTLELANDDKKENSQVIAQRKSNFSL